MRRSIRERMSRMTSGAAGVAVVASRYGGGDQEGQLKEFQRWATGWVVLVVTGAALMGLAVAIYAGRRRGELSTREKLTRGLMIAAAALIAVALISGNGWFTVLVWPCIAASWTLFLVQIVVGGVPAAADVMERAVSQKSRREHRELLVSQAGQSERGEAMEDVLHEMIEERGDEEVLAEAGDDDFAGEADDARS